MILCSNHFLSFEKLYKIIQDFPLYDPCDKGFNFVKSSHRYLTFWSYYSYGHYNLRNNLSKDEFSALKNLAQEKNDIVTKPDKGFGVCLLLDRYDYTNKVNNILNDTPKFLPVSDNVFPIILNYKVRLNRFLRKIKDAYIITQDTFCRLTATGTMPEILYGLPKLIFQLDLFYQL